MKKHIPVFLLIFVLFSQMPVATAQTITPEGQRQILIDNTIQKLSIMGEMLRTYMEQNDVNGALELMNDVLKIKNSVTDGSVPEISRNFTSLIRDCLNFLVNSANSPNNTPDKTKKILETAINLLDKTESYFKEGKNISPDFFAMKGSILRQMGRYKEALDAFKKALNSLE